MIRAEISSTTVNVELLEDTSISVNETVSLVFEPYFPQNISSDSIMLARVQNENLTVVTPGEIIWLGIYIEIPRDVTISAEFAVMTSGQDGHAFATVSGFRSGSNQGKNIQCKELIDSYKVDFNQYSTSDDGQPFIHESQKDTLTVHSMYMTNTGISYQQFNSKPEDDLAMLEAEIYIADHEAIPHNGTFNITFGFKFRKTLIVAASVLILDRTGPFKMVLNSNLSFTHSSFDPTVPVASGEKVYFTATTNHVRNESQIEAYDAVLRFMMPSFFKFVNGSDQIVSNIPTTVVNTKNYLDVNIGHLFFTDILEVNFSLTVDLSKTMVKGLEDLPPVLTSKLICKKGSTSNVLEYCGDASYANYKVDGTECFEDLGTVKYNPCKFQVSSAMNSNGKALMGTKSKGKPFAVRNIAPWDQDKTEDFKIKTRVTQMMFQLVTNNVLASGVDQYKLLFSLDGFVFKDACSLIETP